MNGEDRITLRYLAVAVRLLSMQQLARLRACSLKAATRVAQRLVAHGWARPMRLLAQPIEVRKPLAVWKPGLHRPDPTQIARHANLRYRDVPVQEIDAVSATNRTLQHFGLPCRQPLKRFQQSHDLGLSETFVHFRRRWPLLTERYWVGEDSYRHTRGRGEKVEDAQLRNPCTGKVLLVVEFTGKYKASRVAQFMDDVMSRQLPFACY